MLDSPVAPTVRKALSALLEERREYLVGEVNRIKGPMHRNVLSSSMTIQRVAVRLPMEEE